jgi:hypothetical protein
VLLLDTNERPVIALLLHSLRNSCADSFMLLDGVGHSYKLDSASCILSLLLALINLVLGLSALIRKTDLLRKKE